MEWKKSNFVLISEQASAFFSFFGKSADSFPLSRSAFAILTRPLGGQTGIR
jgi:hypothetical protein